MSYWLFGSPGRGTSSARAGMIAGGAIGLLFGPAGVIVGGIIGAILGNQAEYESLEAEKEKRRVSKLNL